MSIDTPHSEVIMATTFHYLYNLPQELSDEIFNVVAADDDVIYDHATQTAPSKSSLFTTSRKVAADYRKALERRKDGFRKHRVAIHFDLADQGSRATFAPVKVDLPRCASGIHLIITIDRGSATRDNPPFFTDEDVPDLSVLLKTAIEALDLENVLIEVHILDSSHGNIGPDYPTVYTRQLYEGVLHNLRSWDWKGNNNTKPTRIRSAIVGHHGDGHLATPATSSPEILCESAFFRRNGSPVPRAQALLDMFCASEPMSRAIQSGPNPVPFFQPWQSDPVFPPEEPEYKYRGFHAEETPSDKRWPALI